MAHNRGQTLVFINVIASVLLIFSLAIVGLALSARQAEKAEDLKIIAKNIAEAAAHKALWCLNQTEGSNCGGSYGAGYAGETNINFGDGVFDVAVANIDARTKEITAAAYYPTKAKTLGKSTIKVRASTAVDKASFIYGARVGEGGLEMDQNSSIYGSVYSLGGIQGASGAQITGDAYVAQGTALTADQQYAAYNFDLIFGKTSPIIDIAQSFTPNTTDVLNKISLYIKKVGAPSDITVKIVNDSSGSPGSTVYASAALDSSLVSTSYSWVDVSFSIHPLLNSGIKYWIILDADQQSSKYWIIGADAFDDYAGGTMYYCSNWSSCGWYASGYDIDFKTWVGGMETGIDDVSVSGNAYAHYLDDATVGGSAEVYNITDATIGGCVRANFVDSSIIGGSATTTSISDSTVSGNLWCQSHANTSVGGTNYCPVSVTPPVDPGQIALPISGTLINDWKNDAASGGIIEGDYTINENVSLGPKKINGNLIVSGNKTLTLTGTVYVTGSITLQNGASIVLDASFGQLSGVIIADNNIAVSNGVIFASAGAGGYVVVVSAYSHPTAAAISVNNNANASIFYAPYGIIEIANNAALKEATAYKLKLDNNASLVYETGMSDLSFSSGPAGGWSELKGTWRTIE